MKKGLIFILLVSFLSMSLLTGCGGGTKKSTPPTKIYMYATATLYNGNLKKTYANARAGADAIALANLPASLSGKTAHAFISISATDSIANLPTKFAFPTDIPIVNTDGTQTIANNWADLLSGGISNSLDALLTMPLTSWWWSGSNADGTFDDSTCNNCNGWTSNSFSYSGVNGQKNSSGSAWINDGTQNGSVKYYVLCIAY
jgi:hypothetical protein